MTDSQRKDGTTTNAACAHLRVSWRTRTADGGTHGWWECDSGCGAMFSPHYYALQPSKEGIGYSVVAATAENSAQKHSPAPTHPPAASLDGTREEFEKWAKAPNIEGE